jgi:FkbM family methyltransferase
MIIYNHFGEKVDTAVIENVEQFLCQKYISEDDVVLELGARYGSVSCVINKKLKNKLNQVSVEPDERVWKTLEDNRELNECYFHIVRGFISQKPLDLTNKDEWKGGYAATFIDSENTNIPSFTLDDVQSMYGLKFNTLVADCEGYLERFFDENPTFYNQLYKVIFEADYPDKCNYDKIHNKLNELGFQNILMGHQNIYIKV